MSNITLKIAQIVDSVDTHLGGKERFARELTRELTKLGHAVTLVTCDRTPNIDVDCDIRYVRSRKYSTFPSIPSLRDLVEQLNSRFDICHLHYHAFFGENVAIACKMCDQILVTTIHDEMRRGVHKTLYDRALLYILSSLSNRIICLTKGMKSVLVRRGLNEKKTVVIPNAMHVIELLSQASKLNQNTSLGREFDLLFVGRLEERKGVRYLLKALSVLNKEGLRLTLKIVGDGVIKCELMNLAKKLNLSSQVLFTGYVPREELLRSYLKTKFVVIPSLYEGTPNRVALESLALGRPIITTSIPGMESISSNGLGLVASPKSYKAFAEAIRKAFSMENNELLRIKSDGEAFVRQFDWSMVVGQIVELYQNCFNNVG